MSKDGVQVNIIGAGLAGLSAAVTLAGEGFFVNLIARAPSERAQSVMAEGGTNAVLDLYGENDMVKEHAADTLKGGVYLADEEAVKNLTEEAPKVIEWLKGLGMPFNIEDGHIAQRYFGGQKKRRTAFAGSATGKMLMTTLIDHCRYFEEKGLVRRYDHHGFVRLILSADGRECLGAYVQDLYGGGVSAFYGPVLLASGGINGLFPGYTTGTFFNTGDVTATVFAQGVTISNPEMIQYHPTTAPIADKRMLITEAARGEGGRLYTERGGARWYFMEEKYPELKNLMPRDVVAREIYHVLHDPSCEGGVMLDMTAFSPLIWKEKLAELREEIRYQLLIDPAKQPVPVAPGIHYFMGGIDADVCHRTNLKGLYAAGECTSLYHGANRLGGNSTMGAMAGGRIAARTIMGEAFVGERQTVTSTGPVSADTDQDTAEVRPEFAERLGAVLYEGLGIVRDEAGLCAALEKVKEMAAEVSCERERDRLLYAEAMVKGALLRKESRGAHYRSDHPETLEEFRKPTIAVCRDGRAEVTI